MHYLQSKRSSRQMSGCGDTTKLGMAPQTVCGIVGRTLANICQKRNGGCRRVANICQKQALAGAQLARRKMANICQKQALAGALLARPKMANICQKLQVAGALLHWAENGQYLPKTGWPIFAKYLTRRACVYGTRGHICPR